MTAYHFFLANAGYSYGPGETPIQGRRRCAKLLAQAEKNGREAGLSFEWSQDDYLSSEWIADDEDGGKNCDPWQTWNCACHDATGKVIDSLGGIDFGRGGSPWGDTYRRVVEAELAAEHCL